MSDEKKLQQPQQDTQQDEKDTAKISPTWAHECIEDLDDWIESQGIYLRQ